MVLENWHKNLDCWVCFFLRIVHGGWHSKLEKLMSLPVMTVFLYIGARVKSVRDDLNYERSSAFDRVSRFESAVRTTGIYQHRLSPAAFYTSPLP